MICPHCKKPVTRKVHKDKAAEIIKLHLEGFTYRDIEKLTEVPYTTVRHQIRKYKEANPK